MATQTKIKSIKTRKGIVFLVFVILIGTALIPGKPLDPIHYIERESGQLKTEKVAGEKWLKWLYYNPVGEAGLWLLVKRKFVSTIYGKMMDRLSSAKKVDPFIEEYAIDMSIAQEHEFQNFNDFFTRKLTDKARPIDTTGITVVSPADGKILAYTDISASDFIVKGVRFDVATFLLNPDLAQKYRNGSMLVIRLAPVDYHRFHFPVDAKVTSSQQIRGDYFSVNPYALRKKVLLFCSNKREYTELSNPLFGAVIFAEVGATMVGSIVQTYSDNVVKKGDEKGYFKFGGSTVVLLFENNKITIDEDLLKNTAKGYETTVKMGERIGIYKEQ